MPGIWLGENTVPELTKVSEGVMRFSHGTDRTFWPGILIVCGIGIPCVTACTLLALYGDANINPTVMRIALIAFSVTVIFALSYACWCVDSCLIDSRSRMVIREYYFLGQRFWWRGFRILDNDYFAIITTDQDELGTGGFHRIDVCRTKPLFLFSAIHLPSTEPSDTLKKAVDEIAHSLLIENRGYIGWLGFLTAWKRFLTRKT